VRTPDARFEKLSGFQFEPRYVDSLPGYKGLRAPQFVIDQILKLSARVAGRSQPQEIAR
jgi:hypothetical protein